MADLAADQKRVLLAQMAQVGSAAAAQHQQAQADLQAQRQQALAASIGASTAAAGGINDVGGLLTGRMASSADAERSRQADLGQRTQAYSADLDLAAQGNVARRTDTDRAIGNKRAEVEREIGRKRTDMERQLALKRMEIEYDREQKARAAEQEQDDPESQARRLKALLYLEDPEGTTAAERKRRQDDDALASAAGYNRSEKNTSSETIEAVRRLPDYGKAVAAAQRAASQGSAPDVLGEALDAIGVNPVARDLVLAEYVAAQRKNLGRAAPASAYEAE